MKDWKDKVYPSIFEVSRKLFADVLTNSNITEIFSYL